ncbi:YolD-like family protein [Alkalicoccus urumqiensis]|uniref:YolD-like family protein n=1 Tax=Alkalicoccus urumqiensis TaxID=1548213 RepID=A0A2P6MLT5_ALKUR|nr:YolD-like family protein [Alkalicoccus urumqiensis]PRO67218.1 hypothetical protein C6I21_01260 [Alkalicoccus urumqiensis]
MEKYLQRGNLLWEGSRMMLHEHVDALEAHWASEEKVPPPRPDQDALGMMGQEALHALHYEKDVYVTFWEDGFHYKEKGTVEGINELTKELRFAGRRIPFDHLIWVEPAE